MSRTSSDKELNTEPRTFSVDEILAEYRDLLREEEKPAPATRRSARGASAPASAAEEAPEESIRIYQPHRDRNAAPPSRPAEPVPAPKEAPSPAGEESSRSAPPKDLLARYRLKAKDLAADLAARLRGRGRAKAEPEPGELPSFEELLYGKKEGPVRITEEEESPAPTRPSELPRRKADAQMEIRIPEEELRGLSVSTLPPDSWTGLEDSGRAEGGSSPADEQTRLYSREPRREERKASREPTRLFRQPEPAPWTIFCRNSGQDIRNRPQSRICPAPGGNAPASGRRNSFSPLLTRPPRPRKRDGRARRPKPFGNRAGAALPAPPAPAAAGAVAPPSGAVPCRRPTRPLPPRPSPNGRSRMRLRRTFPRWTRRRRAPSSAFCARSRRKLPCPRPLPREQPPVPPLPLSVERIRMRMLMSAPCPWMIF